MTNFASDYFYMLDFKPILKVIEEDYEIPQLGKHRRISALLPYDYETSQKTYPVIYMHDGQMLYDSTNGWNGQEWGVDETLGKLVGEKKVKPCIVVGAYNSGKGRLSDYIPAKPFEKLASAFKDSIRHDLRRRKEGPSTDIVIKSDEYLKFLTQELKPYIDQNYSTLSGKDHTFVSGSSMGGLISMYAICEYPEVFGRAACLSTHWLGIMSPEENPIPASYVQYLAEHLPDPATHKIYFDYGTETLDQYYEPHQLKVDSVMRLKGFSPNNWQTQKFEGANHSENAWKARLHIPFEFLLSES